MDSIPIYRTPAQTGQQTQPAPEPKKPKKKFNRELLSTVAVIVAAPILAIFLTLFVFQSYEVEGESMLTTLHDKDRLIVSKAGRTWSKISASAYAPDRYNIVVFDYSTSSQGTEDKQLIKRVIGLPGDRVIIKDGEVNVYNSETPQGFNVDEKGPESSVIKTTEGNIDETIEDGEVFVMGDNRGNSLDSRIFGPIKTSQIIGTLSLRLFPFDTIKRF